MKKIITVFLALFILTGLIPLRADAAGAMSFDIENSGAKIETVYVGRDDDWTLIQAKTYEYYPDGTLKTVSSGNEYEGHYDPHGNLMDPDFPYYWGYAEGILLAREAKPVRQYDSKGRLIHFEAQALNWGLEPPVLVTADYEYDAQNRVSRVKTNYEYMENEEDENYDSDRYSERWSTGSVFNYSEDGSYSITSDTYWLESGGLTSSSRDLYLYDANHRLVCYAMYGESLDEDGRHWVEHIYRYFYDESGFLIRMLEHWVDGDGIDCGSIPASDKTFVYRQDDDGLLICDVYERNNGNGELEYESTCRYTYDAQGRILEEEEDTKKTRHSYDCEGPASAIDTPTPTTSGPLQLGDTPSAADLDAINAQIRYPRKEAYYLDNYVYTSVKPTTCYAFLDPNAKDVMSEGNWFAVEKGEAVIILAKSSGYACVIFPDLYKAGWINEEHLN